MSSKVMFLYPNHEGYFRAPVGLTLIMTVTEIAGHEVKLFDTTFMNVSENEDDFSPDVEQILEDVQAYGTEWELAMMEFGTVMIDIKSNYEVEDEGLIDKENVPDLAKIKNVIMEIKKTIDSHKKK